MPHHGKTIMAAIAVLLSVSPGYVAGQTTALRNAVQDFVASYQSDVDMKRVTVEKVSANTKSRRIDISLSQSFSYQRFRPEMLDSIYAGLRRAMPQAYRDYSISVSTNGLALERQVPNWARVSPDKDLLFGDTGYQGRPWKVNTSRPAVPVSGLEGRHLMVTPSHGLYYDKGDTLWEWQRPPLYCTHEDLLTQSITYPFLIPMLENAGAVVFTARERDWQTNSVTVKALPGQSYREEGTWQDNTGGGYSTDSMRILPDSAGLVSRVSASGRGNGRSSAMWIPDIPEDGQYAVYVTYRSDSTRTDDARYIVFHTGGNTVFHVNQRMGGGTWLYLGTFNFGKGRNPSGMVTVDNGNPEDGTVSADAVRFGGGMATETRHGLTETAPRYSYGARYYAGYAGAPDSVTAKYDGDDDYREDIWTRPYMTNWLSGGSVFNPDNKGLGVPVELYFALHTDAGYTEADTIYGSLGICTTDFDKRLLASGHSRLVSRDLADMALSELIRDFKAATGREWGWRGVWDKNYCESREPKVQALLVELLSHQNFWDMKLALDPNFQFLASRSIYKAILKQLCFMHETQYVVQPLPVSNFSIGSSGNDLTLRWKAVNDSLEPTAAADGYIVYTAVDDSGFDNGVCVYATSYTVRPEKDHIYRFKVAAFNDGGQSMDSEVLAAGIASDSRGTALIVNGFQRLGPPATVVNDSLLGFDIRADAGVQYMRSPVLCGEQVIFSRSTLRYPEKESLGISNDSLGGRILAGNTFDYPQVHGRSMLKAGWSFVSCSRESLADGDVKMTDYKLTDIILGLQKRSSTDSQFGRDYSCFPAAMQQQIRSYMKSGGRLLVSGSFVGTDVAMSPEDLSFAADCLHFRPASDTLEDDADQIQGRRIATFNIRRTADSGFYGASHPDILEPAGRGERLLTYGKGRRAAVIGTRNAESRSIVMGFPYESISTQKERDHVMRYLLNYLTEK